MAPETDNILQAVNPRADESREHLRRLVRLRSTVDLIAAWEKLTESLAAVNSEQDNAGVFGGFYRVNTAWITPATVENAADLIKLGMERDALQEERPDGCWCLGIGGRGTAVVPQMGYHAAEDVFSEFCPCPDGQTERLRVQHTRGKRSEEARKIRLDRHWQACGIPKRFQNLRLATSPLCASMPELIARLIPESAESDSTEEDNDAWYVNHLAWKRSWLFFGAFGTGKTGLAVGYAWEYAHLLEDQILFLSLPDLLAELRATYNRPKRKQNNWLDEESEEEPETEGQLIERLATVDLLILDDLGAEQVKETGDGSWVADRLFQIIGKRHAEELTTVFTSNYSIEQLAHRIGDRLAWRIVEMCGKDHIIHVEGRNLRA